MYLGLKRNKGPETHKDIFCRADLWTALFKEKTFFFFLHPSLYTYLFFFHDTLKTVFFMHLLFARYCVRHSAYKIEDKRGKNLNDCFRFSYSPNHAF